MLPDIPHIEQYSGAWSMHEPAFLAMVAQVERMDVAAHVRARMDAGVMSDGEPFQVVDGIAVIEIVGMMTKFGSSLSDTPGSVTLRKAVRNAAADNAIRGILLRFDSGGGMVAGTDDLAQDVARANTIKPVVAYIEDMCASAAYYVASQCGRVVANVSAIIGGIGIYAAIQDFSAAFAEQGVKVHVIKSAELKGAGEEGTKITDAQLAEFQRAVDSFADLFVTAVARGRGMSVKKAKALADGRVHVGAEAIPLGLIDAVETLDEAMADLQQRADKRENSPPVPVWASTEETSTMSTNKETTETPERMPATLAELKTTLSDSNAEFRELCIESGATLADAQGKWMAKLREQNAKLAEQATTQDKKIADMESAAKAKEEMPGVEALGAGATDGTAAAPGDPASEWHAAVDAKVKAGMKKGAAIAAVVKEDPALQRAFVASYNTEHRTHRSSIS